MKLNYNNSGLGSLALEIEGLIAKESIMRFGWDRNVLYLGCGVDYILHGCNLLNLTELVHITAAFYCMQIIHKLYTLIKFINDTNQKS